MYKIDKSDSEKKVEDSLDNVENEQFISSQQGVTIGLPLMIFVTLNILLPVFIINSFTKYIISFLMLLFFVWIIIKFYPTPDELNDKLKSKLAMIIGNSFFVDKIFVLSCHEIYLYSDSSFQVSIHLVSTSLTKLLNESPGFPFIFPPPSSTLFHSA